jgi:hypothetical protein
MDKQFIEFFYKHLAARRIKCEDMPTIENHLALAEVRRVPSHRGGFRPPVVELLCRFRQRSRHGPVRLRQAWV